MSLGLSVKFFLSTENFQSPTGKDLKIIDPMGICSSQSTIPGQKCPLPLGHQLIGAHIEYLNSVCKLRIKNQRRCVFCYNSDDRLLWSSSWCHSPRVFWLMVAPVGNVRYIFHFGNRTLRLLINLLLPVLWHSLSNWSLSDIKRWVTDLMEVVFWKLFNFFFLWFSYR